MVLTGEQAVEIKKQLLEQIDRMPNENKESIKKYVEGLDEEGLEDFLKQNNIKFDEDGLSQGESKGGGSDSGQKCIFCEIASGNVQSYKIMENDKAVAVLDINPLSKGHTMILPKKHLSTEKIPKSALSLAQKIAKRIKKKLKAEDVKIETFNLQGHGMINVIPFYKDTQLKKTKAEEKELIALQKKLEFKNRKARGKKAEKETEKSEEEIKKEISKLPKIASFRIP